MEKQSNKSQLEYSYEDDVYEEDEDALEEELASSYELNARLKKLELEYEEAPRHSQISPTESNFSRGSRGSEAHRRVVANPQKSHSFTRDQMIKIQRDNLNLLGNLERIQRKGGGISSNKPKKPVKHVAASAVNRRKKHNDTAMQNLAFLKRLQNVKPTLATGGRTGPSPRRNPKPPGPRNPKKRPEWVDVTSRAY